MLRRLSIAAVAVLLIAATTAAVQAGPPPPKTPPAAVGANAAQANPLNLSPSQQSQFKAISETSSKRSQEILANISISRAARSAQLLATVATMVHEQRALLDQKQQKVYERLRAAFMETRTGRDPLHRSEEQRIASEVIRSEEIIRINALVADKSIPQKQKVAKADALQDQFLKDQLAVLSSPQRKLLSQMQAQQARLQASQQGAHGAPGAPAHP